MSSKTEDRKTRYKSHALVEFKKAKWLPFGVHSGVLLDLSLDGFKLEFTGEVYVKPNSTSWVSIPLSPLGIKAPGKFQGKVEVRWFDEKRFRIGGTFQGLSTTDKQILAQVIEVLEEKGLANL